MKKLFLLILLSPGLLSASTATRYFSTLYPIPDVYLDIKIEVTPDQGVKAYGLEETIPQDYNMIKYDSACTFKENILKCGIYLDNKPRTFTYTMTPAKDSVSTIKHIQGVVSFDGVSQVIQNDLGDQPSEKQITDKGSAFEVTLDKALPVSGTTVIDFQKSSPTITTSLWNGQDVVSINAQNINVPGVFDPLTNTVKWDRADLTVEAFHLDPKPGMEDGGIEFQFVLKSLPITNFYNFNITGWENFDFFYQPPLNEEAQQVDPATCKPTECRDSQGNLVNSRPENVVGSYAVYHKTKKDHKQGSLNYATGKAFHIYRPKAVDANGNEAWCGLSYSAGVLSIEVPQSFLDTAVYPVKF